MWTVWNHLAQRFVKTVVYQAGRLAGATAVADGARRSLGWIQDILLLGVVDELEEQGLSRKVIADILGMTTRTFQRHLSAARAGSQVGITLWQFIHRRCETPQTKEAITAWFPASRKLEIHSLLRDMIQSGWMRLEEDMYQAQPLEDVSTDEHMLEYIVTAFVEAQLSDVDIEVVREEGALDDELSLAAGGVFSAKVKLRSS